MKKLLTKLTFILLVLAMAISIVGCGSNSFTKTQYTSWGKVESNYGFLATTENYVYFINGIGTSTDDNSYGAPIKGSLMVAPKSDLTKAEIAVPKLFVASDYNSGLFLAGSGNETYVYYGTPNVEKNSSGSVANSELTFMRTRLDGENTTTYFTVSDLSTEYRFIEVNNVVYIVYYDSTDTALKCYNTSTKEDTTIIKTDDEAQESLDKYVFIGAENADTLAVVYTTTVYLDQYNEEAESRITADYNKVYAYNVKDGSKVLFNGAETGSTYTLDIVNDNYLFYKESNKFATESTFAYSILDGTSTKIANTDAVADATFIVSLSEIYTLDTENSYIFKDTLVELGKEEVVANVAASAAFFIDNGYIYYCDSSVQLSRIKLNDNTANEELVSESTITKTWFAPEVVEIAGEKVLFYCDGTYVNCVNINKTATEKVEDETTTYYLEGNKLVGEKISADIVSAVSTKIGNITIDVDSEEGVSSDTFTIAKTAYDALTADQKAMVSSDDVTKLNNYEKAIELSEKLFKLNDMRYYEFQTEARQAELKTLYLDAKAYVEGLGSNAETIRALCDNNLNWNYQEAAAKFAD